MKNTKPKVRLWSVLTGLTAILTVAAIVGNIIANQYATTLNVALNASTYKIIKGETTGDTEYFKKGFASDEEREAYAVSYTHLAQQNEKRDIECQQRELKFVEAGALGCGVEHIGQPQQRQQHPQRPQAGVRPVLERDAERHRSSPPQQCPEDDMACKKIHSTPPM